MLWQDTNVSEVDAASTRTWLSLS